MPAVQNFDLPPSRFEMGTVATRHGAVAYRVGGGDGPWLVLLHGSSFSMAVFQRQFEGILASNFRLVALDFPGHGLSQDAERPRETYTMTGLSESVLDALSALGIKRYAVLGWSLGGHVAIELASRSDRVTGLALTGSPPVAPGMLSVLSAFKISREVLQASQARWSPSRAARFELASFGPGERRFEKDMDRADGRLRPLFARSMIAGKGVNQKKFTETTTIPIRVLHGSRDLNIRASYLRKLRFRNPDSGISVFENGGHALFWEQPAIFDQVLNDFLSRLRW
jgi:pimeloyl-ACP methyl ester carboxylesterase